MSHRLTLETNITDRESAIDALRENKVEFTEAGDTLTLKTGVFNGTTINLKTGSVQSADVDYLARERGGQRVTNRDIGLLRQWYAEAKFRNESLKEGVQITNREEVIEGGRKVILLTWQSG